MTAQKLAVVLTWKHPGPAIMNPQLQAGMGLAVWDSGRSQGARWNNCKRNVSGPGCAHGCLQSDFGCVLMAIREHRAQEASLAVQVASSLGEAR